MVEARKPGKKRSRSAMEKSVVYRDLIGNIVRIPAKLYGIDVPGMYYRAKVIKRDTSHKHALVLSFFEDDGSQHWAPARDIRKWFDSARAGNGKCTGIESDKYAAETLLQFRELPRQKGTASLKEHPQCTNRQQESPAQAGKGCVEAEGSRIGPNEVESSQSRKWQDEILSGALLSKGKIEVDNVCGGGQDSVRREKHSKMARVA